MLDTIVYNAFEQAYLKHYRQAMCPRRIQPDRDLQLPFPHLGNVSTAKQEQVYEHDEGICYLCRLPVEMDGPEARQPTVDHVIPRCRGGSNERENLRLAHRQCNHLKGEQPHYRFIFARDEWCCRKCHAPIAADEQEWTFWNHPVVEHVYPLHSGEVWFMMDYAWSVHERCRLMWTIDGTYSGGVQTSVMPVDAAVLPSLPKTI